MIDYYSKFCTREFMMSLVVLRLTVFSRVEPYACCHSSKRVLMRAIMAVMSSKKSPGCPFGSLQLLGISGRLLRVSSCRRLSPCTAQYISEPSFAGWEQGYQYLLSFCIIITLVECSKHLNLRSAVFSCANSLSEVPLETASDPAMGSSPWMLLIFALRFCNMSVMFMHLSMYLS